MATAASIATGTYTQAGALAAGLIVLLYLFAPRFRVIARGTALLSLVLCLSLLLTGAGVFAFDLPL